MVVVLMKYLEDVKEEIFVILLREGEFENKLVMKIDGNGD